MFSKIVKSVSGTAGEALEVHEFRRLRSRYDNPTVVKAIVEGELKAAGESWESLTVYLRFKQKVQRDEISFLRAAQAAEAAVREDLQELRLGGA